MEKKLHTVEITHGIFCINGYSRYNPLPKEEVQVS